MIKGPLKIAYNALDMIEMGLTGIMHEQTCLLNVIRDIWTSNSDTL
jgi:hypothetical protein